LCDLTMPGWVAVTTSSTELRLAIAPRDYQPARQKSSLLIRLPEFFVIFERVIAAYSCILRYSRNRGGFFSARAPNPRRSAGKNRRPGP